MAPRPQEAADDEAAALLSPTAAAPPRAHPHRQRRVLLAMLPPLLLLALLAGVLLARASPVASHADAGYAAPSAWPTSLWPSYFLAPADAHMTAVPRPAVTDVAHTGVYGDALATAQITGAPSRDAVFPRPSAAAPANLTATVLANVTALIRANAGNDSCATCLAALALGQTLARAAPHDVPGVLQTLCERFSFLGTASGLALPDVCRRTYAPAALGAAYTQVLSYANLSAGAADGRYLCHYVAKAACPLPAPRVFDAVFLDAWFGGAAQRAALARRQLAPRSHAAAGKTLRVLHFSDIHVDPRFVVGAEARCSSGQCCRAESFNSSVAAAPPLSREQPLPAGNLSEAAVYWGNYKCDSPWSLALSALAAVKHVNGRAVDMSLYTGDMVTHDAVWHISRELVRYTQQAMYDVFKRLLGSGPVFSAIGNHDTAPSDFASPSSLPDDTRAQFSYDWLNLRRLFVAEGWFTHAEAQQVGRHYGGFSVSPRQGLRVVVLNTDFWYKGNVYNYLNASAPDSSGNLRWLTRELERAEEREERVWIVGHVLTGWDGSNGLDNPTTLFHHIVSHFSPKTVAHIFFGHTHEDQFNVFFPQAANATSNATALAPAHEAQAVAFMAPSITPGSNVNSAFRIYTVTEGTWEVHDYDEYYADVSSFPELPGTDHGPVWRHLYSAREAYSNFSVSAAAGNYSGQVPLSSGHWPASAPLNATFWAALTDEMRARPALVDAFRERQGRNSPRARQCADQACRDAMVCYMRAADGVEGKKCPSGDGFASVQS